VVQARLADSKASVAQTCHETARKNTLSATGGAACLRNGMPVPRGLLSATKLWHSTSTQTLKSDSVCEATFLLGSPAAPLRGALKTVGNSLAAPASGGAWRDLHKR